MTPVSTTNPPVLVSEAEILRVETGHVLLSWPVGADPNTATRRWVRRIVEYGEEAVGRRVFLPAYVTQPCARVSAPGR